MFSKFVINEKCKLYNLQLKPAGEGYFYVCYGNCIIQIRDIHPGYGGEEIGNLIFRKGDALKFIRVLNLCNIKLNKPIDWKLMGRIRGKINIKYMYRDD